MEVAELTKYLSDSREDALMPCMVLANDRDEQLCVEAKKMQEAASGVEALRGHVIFATSGSTGKGKWVALSRRALLASARAVNEHLNAGEQDRWLLSLPTFHVGGFGILARCVVSSAECVQFEGKWNTVRFHQALSDHQVTLTSLVPTQLVDLVNARLTAPERLRAVLVGGGSLADAVYEQAISLGWPVIETYGMTEASSQIATADYGSRDLRILPCWSVKADSDHRLCIQGEPLMTGYVTMEKGGIQLEGVSGDGWHITNDLVQLTDGGLKMLGRVDRSIKILGELVNLANVERKFNSVLDDCFYGVECVVVSMNDARRNAVLYACVENFDDRLEAVLKKYNERCTPFCRIEKIIDVEKIPKTSIGKIDFVSLCAIVEQRVSKM